MIEETNEEARKLAISDLKAVEARCLRKSASAKEAAKEEGAVVEHDGFKYATCEEIHDAYGIGAITETTFWRLSAELEKKQDELDKGRTRWDEEAEIIDDIIWSLENMRPVSEKGAKS